MIFFAGLACLLAMQGRLLQIEVVAGEGAVHPAGSRGSPNLVVRVTDELGAPVAGAIVSFRLPDDGPGGAFASGLATEITNTGPDGRAAAPPVRWNHVHGALEIRVTAAKEGTRAGTAVLQHISERPASAQRRLRAPGRKWLYIFAIAGGGAAAGILGARAGGGSRPAGASPADVEIGAPSVIIGKP
jgi:hypothetical protein